MVAIIYEANNRQQNSGDGRRDYDIQQGKLFVYGRVVVTWTMELRAF